MNNHKLEQLMLSPKRESMLHRLRNTHEDWLHSDKRCRYHRRDYGQGYNLANKIVEKFLGQPLNLAVSALKNNVRYKNEYFFRRGVDEVIFEVQTNKIRWNWFSNDLYITKENNIIRKRPDEPKRVREPYVPVIFNYMDGTEIHNRKGIHYFLVKRGYYHEYWNKSLQMYCGEHVPDHFWQLSTYWLRFYNLANNPKEY